MKRIFLNLMIIGLLLIPIHAQAKSKTWVLYLTPNMATTTVTVQNGGVSTMVVKGQGIQRRDGITTIDGLQYTDSGTWTVQIDDITVSAAQIAAGGDYSGASFWVVYKESMYTSSNHFDKATGVTIFDGMALSGASRVQKEIFPVAMGAMQFDFITGGNTVFSGATVLVRVYDEKER